MHPAGLVTNRQCFSWTAISNAGLCLTLVKIISGGKKYPATLQQIAAVIGVPLSADVTIPTCLFPLNANTFGTLFGTVVIDESTLKIRLGSN